MRSPLRDFRDTLVFAGLALALAAAPALSQQPVSESPAPLGTVVANGSITSSGTFQSIFAAQGPQAGGLLRRGCLVINTSNTVAYVFFGAIAQASTPKSVPLNAATADGLAGGSVACERPGAGTIQDQVSIVGATTGETFFAIRY